MRVDCYNACECAISEIEIGDTFYYDGYLYIRANEAVIAPDNCVAVRLDSGDVSICRPDLLVTKADTKVVVNTKDINGIL